jgi:hypothetical protein
MPSDRDRSPEQNLSITLFPGGERLNPCGVLPGVGSGHPPADRSPLKFSAINPALRPGKWIGGGSD